MPPSLAYFLLHWGNYVNIAVKESFSLVGCSWNFVGYGIFLWGFNSYVFVVEAIGSAFLNEREMVSAVLCTASFIVLLFYNLCYQSWHL